MSHRQAFKKILVAVDGSEVSIRATEHAARLAKQDGASLTALHVVPTPPFEATGELGEYYNIARRETKKWMRDIENAAQAQGVAAKTDVVVGAYSVVDTIIGYAETTGVDLLVTGTRGKTPTQRIRLGSVASGLVEYAGCAVLVIR